MEATVSRKGKRITQKQHGRLCGVSVLQIVRPTEQAMAVAGFFQSQMEWRLLDRFRPAGQPQGDCWLVLNLAIIADNGLALAAEQRAGVERALEPGSD